MVRLVFKELAAWCRVQPVFSYYSKRHRSQILVVMEEEVKVTDRWGTEGRLTEGDNA